MFGRDVYIFLSKSGSGFYMGSGCGSHMGSECGLMGGRLDIASFGSS